MSPSNGSASGVCGHGGTNYTEHHVSRMDTLAGIAIKYGVEVADIKRLNGLATDLQMFALKKLRIPLPGRHPPSPCVSDGSAITGGGSVVEEFFHFGQPNTHGLRLKTSTQKVSPAMSTLQKFYGLKSETLKCGSEGVEMGLHRTGNSHSDCIEDELFPRTSLLSTPPSNVHLVEHVQPGDGEGEKSDEKLVRRRQKAEVDNGVSSSNPERLLKGENSGGNCFSSASNGKGLAMRPKSGSRAMLASESEQGWITSIPVGMGDAIITDGISEVHKSLSTSNLRDQDINNSASLWPALSSGAITKPLFDGLPNPITGRRNKAALD